MQVEEIQHSLTTLPPARTERSKGIHVSNIIRCIASDTGILKSEWAEDASLTDVRQITDPIAILRISMGLAWEEWYIPRLPEVSDHPGELQVDGVYMSPDGESLEAFFGVGMQSVIHEVKATYKSVKTVGDLRTQWMWLSQIQAYCKARETLYAKLHVLFVCGDYKYPITPQLKVWRLVFTEQEIADNWKLLTDYRNDRLSIV